MSINPFLVGSIILAVYGSKYNELIEISLLLNISYKSIKVYIMEQFNKIYNIFKSTNLKIIDENKLKEYIQFCIKNNTERVKYQTASHHILPQSKHLPFKQYSNLNENVFNKSILTHKNHYIAHKLLYESIEHISIVSAFIAMNNKDKSLGRIDEQDLISPEKYHEAMAQRTKTTLEWFYSPSEHDNKLTNIQYIAKKGYYTKGIQYWINHSEKMKVNNIINYPGAFEKMRNTKINKIIDGKNMDTIAAERAAVTMNKEIILEDGTCSTIYKENGKKVSKFLNKEIILEDGTVTTPASLRAIDTRKSLQRKSKKYLLKNIFKENINFIMYAADIRRISAALDTITIDNYLGKTKYGKSILIKNNKENLIGLYTIPTNEDATYMTIDEINELIKKL